MNANSSKIEVLAWSGSSWADYVFWQSQDPKKLRRINTLIKATMRSPFEGIGKPEPLKHELAGFWSRRIDHVHRLVYAIDDDRLTIISCRHHYL